eukprot:TRINITY_DN39034_c0_g1_i2.p1 TRINITY_DN39034_c0_g1~~TRINITY_DN39034_c0_g1_i2.p1  ORF type:complete len:695 (+),score=100.91 TRINITY_DN39034_c0_g1_i2:42-2087(+)
MAVPVRKATSAARQSEHNHGRGDDEKVSVASRASSERKLSLARPHMRQSASTKLHPLDLSYQLVPSEHDLEATDLQVQAHAFVHGVSCQMVVAGLILANAIVIGFETQNPANPHWNVVETIFLALFTVELFLKLCLTGPADFFDTTETDAYWNIFDVVVVGLGIVDAFVTWSAVREHGHTAGGDFPTLLRVVRLTRLLRVFRLVRFLRQLYMLAWGFGMAAVAVFWVAVLMTFVLYVSSVVLVRTMGKADEDDPNYETLRLHFGSIGSSMLTLFSLLAVPDLEPYSEVLRSHPFFLVFCVGYVIFGSFGLIGLLNSVIMESMFDKNELRQEEEQKVSNTKQAELMKKLLHVFDEAPHLEGGEVATSTLVSLIPSIGELFRTYGFKMSHTDLKMTPQVIDLDQSGAVSREEYEDFLFTVLEGVRPMLIMKTLYALENSRRSTEEAIEAVSEKLQAQMDRLQEKQDQQCEDTAKLLALVGTVLSRLEGGSFANSPGMSPGKSQKESPRTYVSGAQPVSLSKPFASGNVEVMEVLSRFECEEFGDFQGTPRLAAAEPNSLSISLLGDDFGEAQTEPGTADSIDLQPLPLGATDSIDLQSHVPPPLHTAAFMGKQPFGTPAERYVVVTSPGPHEANWPASSLNESVCTQASRRRAAQMDPAQFHLKADPWASPQLTDHVTPSDSH